MSHKKNNFKNFVKSTSPIKYLSLANKYIMIWPMANITGTGYIITIYGLKKPNNSLVTLSDTSDMNLIISLSSNKL